jgi:hypothetical protein
MPIPVAMFCQKKGKYLFIWQPCTCSFSLLTESGAHWRSGSALAVREQIPSVWDCLTPLDAHVSLSLYISLFVPYFTSLPALPARFFPLSAASNWGVFDYFSKDCLPGLSWKLAHNSKQRMAHSTQTTHFWGVWLGDKVDSIGSAVP